MPQVMLIGTEGEVIANGGMELFERWENQRYLSIWLNFAPEEQSDAITYFERFGANEYVIQDVLKPRLPPKIDRFDDSTLVILRGILDPPSLSNFKSIQISAFLGSNWLITYQHELSPSVQQAYIQALHHSTSTNCGQILMSILQVLTKRYIDWMLSVDSQLLEDEERLFSHPDDELLENLINYKKTLRQLKRTFSYHERLGKNLFEEGLSKNIEPASPDLNDIANKFERLRTMVDMYYDQMNDLIEGYISISSHRLNHTMRILTVITAIFVPLSFLVGMYGMNFEFMPELKWRYGYFFLLSLMGLTAFSLIQWFKRKRWL